MATAVLEHPQNQTATWTGIFPTDSCTETQSTLFVKKLLAVSLSNITYLRAIFPEAAFGDRCLEDIQLKILKDNTRCLGASQVVNWIRGCFDALDKKYLRQAILGIYVDCSKENSLIESYTYRFTYTGETEMTMYRNEERIMSSESRKSTIMLLRTLIILMQSLHPLPDDVMLTMKLFYYDDVTPPEYEPPGFKKSEAGNFCYDVETINLKIGDVATKFHTVNLRMKTGKAQFECQEVEPQVLLDPQAEKPNNKVVHTQDIQKPSQDLFFDSLVELSEEAVTPMEEDAEVALLSATQTVSSELPEVNETKLPEEVVGKSKRPVDEKLPDDIGVRCPCSSTVDDGLMVSCDGCRYWQHAICFKLMEEECVPVKHICPECAKRDPRLVPTDPHLSGLPTRTIQNVCLWRRVILLCSCTERISVASLSNCLDVNNEKAELLFARLENEGYLLGIERNGKRRTSRQVNTERVQSEGVAKYLNLSMEPPVGRAEGAGVPPADTDATPDIVVPSQATGPSQESQIDVLTDQTSDLRVKPPRINSLFKIQKNDKGGQKRKVSSKNTGHEFDEVEDGSSQTRAKRLKTSEVARPLMV